MHGIAKIMRPEQEVIINAPLEAVWAFSTDLTKIPTFHPRVVKVDLLSGKTQREPGVAYQCHLVLHGKSVVVVEGFFDCLHVHQAGLPCVVALMGCSLSHRQAQLLQAHFQEVTLLLDGDRAGRSAGEAIAARLVSKLSVKLVEIPDGRQPDQLSNDQIRCLCIPDYF
jgi:hypothetical protein